MEQWPHGMGTIIRPGPYMVMLGGHAVAHKAMNQDKEWEENHHMGSCQICSLSKDGICHLQVDSTHSSLPLESLWEGTFTLVQ